MNAHKIKALVRLVVSAIVAVVAIMLFITIINTNISVNQQHSGNPTVVIKEVVLREDVQSINLNWYIGGIEVIPSDGNELRIVEKTYVNMDTNKSFEVSNNNGELTIQSRNKAYFNFMNWMVEPSFLQIYLPKDMSLNQLQVNAISGTYEISQLTLDSLEVNMTSGTLNLDTIEAQVLDLTLLSGNVNIRQGKYETSNIMMTSGDLKYDAITDRFMGDLISGKMNLRFLQRPSAFDLQVTSGSVSVDVMTTEAFSIALNKTSGSFTSNLNIEEDIYHYLSGGPQYNIDMVSGSINFRSNSE